MLGAAALSAADPRRSRGRDSVLSFMPVVPSFARRVGYYRAMPSDSEAKINVLLVGGGGREHAIAVKLAGSPRLGDLWTTHPQNPGIAALAKPVDVPVHIREIYRLQQFNEKKKIGLVVIGPEEPLAEG